MLYILYPFTHLLCWLIYFSSLYDIVSSVVRVRSAGTWHRGGMTGSGTLKCQDGRFYRGDFVNSERHGQGENYLCCYILRTSGQITTIQYLLSIRTLGYYYYLREGDEGDADRFYSGGRGSLYRIMEYEGAWVHGAREGLGKVTWVNRDTIEGPFRGGHPHGVCLYTYKRR